MFVNNDEHYLEQTNILLKLFLDSEKIRVIKESIKRGKDFTQVIIIDKNFHLELKVDIINDVAKHFGELEYDDILGRIDSWRNILSNKITALFRSEPKDVADILYISLNKSFNWKEIINEAKTKEVGVEAELIYDILMSFPIKYFNQIKWINKPNLKEAEVLIKKISGDILFGKNNSILQNL